jgi:hypothetical protein
MANRSASSKTALRGNPPANVRRCWRSSVPAVLVTLPAFVSAVVDVPSWTSTSHFRVHPAKGPDEQYADFPRRRSFLIDPDGIVRRIYDVTDTAGHPQQVLDDLMALGG